MFHKIAVVGATAAAIVGVGTAALAASGSTATAGNGTSGIGGHGTSGAAAGHHKKHAARALLRHAVHGQITTKGKAGYVTHSAIRGSVTAVSATSISVRASDGFAETFTISKATKVRERTAGKARATAGTLSEVKDGDNVAVLGKAPATSTANPTATVVVDGLKKK